MTVPRGGDGFESALAFAIWSQRVVMVSGATGSVVSNSRLHRRSDKRRTP